MGVGGAMQLGTDLQAKDEWSLNTLVVCRSALFGQRHPSKFSEANRLIIMNISKSLPLLHAPGDFQSCPVPITGLIKIRIPNHGKSRDPAGSRGSPDKMSLSRE